MSIEGTYIVNKPSADDIMPEDTLADAQSKHTSIEKPIERGIYTIAFLSFLIAAVLIGAKAFDLQVVNGTKYAMAADQRSKKTIALPPIRGVIYDDQGRRLADNEPILDLVIMSAEFNSSKERENSVEQLATNLARPTQDIEDLANQNMNTTSFVLQGGISKEQALKLQNINLPGVYVVPDIKRRYLLGDVFGQVLGHMSQVSTNLLKTDPFYQINDRVGSFGVEAAYETALRGEHVNLPLSKESWTAIGEPVTGKDVYLTLDEDYQKELYQSLTAVLKSSGLKKGAAIVQDVRSGAILAMVSVPSFDPNAFEVSNDPANQLYLKSLFNDPLQPLFNRAISGRYAPGSTIKPLYGMAGLKEGTITPSTIIYSAGAISVKSENDPNVTYVFKDWKVHGATDLKKAIADSVDVYFYAIGGGYQNIKGMGSDTLVKYLRSALADKILGIDIPNEKSGVVPDKQSKLAAKGESWYVGDTYNLSIGQGDLLVTPLWLNTYVSAIANGGKLMKPYLGSSIRDGDSIVSATKSQILDSLPFDQRTILTIQDAMRAVVTSGTGLVLNDLAQPVAAKTGTAQVGKGTNSLIISYGPYDNPAVALTVVIEGTEGKYGQVHQVAHDFFSWYFAQHPK